MSIELIPQIVCNTCKEEFEQYDEIDLVMYKGRTMYYEHDHCSSEGSRRADTAIFSFKVDIEEEY